MKLYIIFITFAILINIIQSSLIGIDFGSQFFKISLIAPRKSFVIVESRASQRKVENAVNFGIQQRNYENDAINRKSKVPELTFTFVKKFLGALESDQEVFEVSKQQYDNYISSFNNTDLLFELQGFKFPDSMLNPDQKSKKNQKILLKTEDIIAMILKYAKSLSETMSESQKEITECVITVPSHWGFSQRIALKNSASLAGLEVIQLIKENTAAAVHFGKDRLDTKPYIVLFYNIGAQYMQASLVEYSSIETDLKDAKQMEVVKVLEDSALSYVGGHYYDIAIAQFFATEIDQQEERIGKPSVKENPEIMLKLIKSSQKVKEILSANKEAFINIEGLYDNKDFQSKITREQFINQSQHLLDQVLVPIKEVLKNSKKTIQDIQQVEILGGGIRIPKIQEILKEYLGENNVGTHMNGDESMAQGAVLYAFQNSKVTQSKKMLVQDGFNYKFLYDVSCLNKNVDENNENYVKIDKQQLFPYRKRVGTKKSIEFTKTLCNLKIDVHTEDINGKIEPFASYNLTNISKTRNHKFYNETQQKFPHVMLQFEIDSVTGINLSKSELSFNYTEFAKPKKSKNSTETEKPPKQQKGKNKQQKVNIDVKTSFNTPFSILSNADIIKGKKIHKKFELMEKKYQKDGQNKNQLEQLVYETRDNFENPNFVRFSSEMEKQQIKTMITEFLNWIQQDGIDSSSSEVKTNLKKLQDLTDPIKKRQKESEIRDDAVKDAYKQLQKLKEDQQQLEKTHTWVSEQQQLKLKNRIEQTKTWLDDKMKYQKHKPDYENPMFYVSEIQPKLYQINEEYSAIKNSTKPKKEKEEAKQSFKTKSSEQNKSDL